MSDTTGDGAATSGDRSREGRAPDARDGEPTTDHETTGRPASRRRLLAAGGGAVATLLAGCSGLLPGRGEPTIEGDSFVDGNQSNGDGTDGTGTPTRTPTPETDVVGLVLGEGGPEREFSVTLSPPEESGGADWWQLETLGGERIVRESFDEPRTGERFTTSRTVDPDATKVVVRGHDVEAGYGGQVILVDLERGELVAEKQGPEPRSFEGYEF